MRSQTNRFVYTTKAWQFLLAVLVLIPVIANAEHEEDEYERWSVDIERYDLDIRFSDGRVFDTTLTFVGAQGWQGFGEHVSGGLRGGFADYDQNANPLLSGLSPHNFFIGFGFDVHGSRQARFSPMLRAYFDFVDLRDSNDTRDVEIHFFSLTLKAGARVRFGRVQWLFGGVGYAIDGSEEISGDIQNRRDIEADKAAGAFMEVEFPLGADGSFSLGVESGARDGWLISFARDF